MTTFEYLSVFISIVIGLGVVRVLGGVAKLLDPQESKAYWLHSTWVAYFIFWLPWFWWFEFDWRFQTTWTFPVFFFVVLFAMLFYLAVAVLVPSREADYKDLESYFYRVRPRFFALMTLINIADVIDKKVARQLDMMVRLIEPALLMVMGGAVLFVIVALLLPVFEMSTSMS